MSELNETPILYVQHNNQLLNNKDLYILVNDLYKIQLNQFLTLKKQTGITQNNSNFVKQFLEMLQEYMAFQLTNDKYIPIKTIVKAFDHIYALMFLSKSIKIQIYNKDKFRKIYFKNRGNLGIKCINYMLKKMIADMLDFGIIQSNDYDFKTYLKYCNFCSDKVLTKEDKEKLNPYNQYKKELSYLRQIKKDTFIERMLKYCNSNDFDLYILYSQCTAYINQKNQMLIHAQNNNSLEEPTEKAINSFKNSITVIIDYILITAAMENKL